MGTGDTSGNQEEEKGFVFQELTQRNHQDLDLRPRKFDDFIGQERTLKNLRIFLEAAKLRQEPLDHVLLSGMPGLGKTTLSHIIAHEMAVDLKITSGPALERSGDLVGILSNLKRGEILFIDEIHRLPRVVEEYLYAAMEDYCIDIVLDKGPAARSVRLGIERFTLIGATTREGLLTSPMRARFGVLEKLELYPVKKLTRILARTAALLNVEVDKDTLELIASRSRGVPRVTNRLLRRIRDLAQVQGKERINRETAIEGMAMMGIDGEGLVAMDRRILETIARGRGEAVGLKTISVSVGEEEDTIEDVYEPFLIQKGYILKTPRGRKITPEGEKHINFKAGSTKGGMGNQDSLFSK
ncbi:MAG: Holliday junction branch migration DNA helicase RuvB [Planctomycetota bacterium]